MAKNEIQDWANEISAFCSEGQEHLSAEVAQRARILYKRIVALSPSPSFNVGGYSQGHFLKNYRIGARPQVGEIPGEEDTAQTFKRIDAQIPDDYFMANQTVTMTNSTSYIADIEYKGWQRTPAYAPIAKALAAEL